MDRRPSPMSMTGFGRAQGPVGPAKVALEIATLNLRGLEVHLALPPRWSRAEPRLRQCVTERLSRGKVRVNVRTPEAAEGFPTYAFNPQAAAVYRESFARLQEELGTREVLSVRDLLLAPGVVAPVGGVESEGQDEELDALEELARRALTALEEARRAEGRATAVELRGQADRIRHLCRALATKVPEVRAELRRRYETRLRELTQGLALAEERVLAEAVLAVERTDVSEELVRLEAHVESFLGALEAGGAVGRRLSFLAQEMNREANTIGSKAVCPGCVQLVVELKDEIAKAREQVENLE